jgi:hypothetical protein
MQTPANLLPPLLLSSSPEITLKFKYSSPSQTLPSWRRNLIANKLNNAFCGGGKSCLMIPAASDKFHKC